MIQDNFHFHVPVSVIKAGDGNNSKMILGGIASTADKDREDENLIPEGFDCSYLMENGYINWHHQTNKDPSAVIGEPIKAEVRKGQGLYIEGELYPNSEMAKSAYALVGVLKSDSKRRKMGWSIEGKVVERDPMNPKRVLKAKITGVALTPMPINPNTFVNIIKGMNDETVLEADKSEGNGGGVQVIKMGGKEVSIRKGEDDDELLISIKAMTTDSARAVIPESVEGGTKPKIGEGFPPELRNNKKMSKSEAYEYLFANYPKMSINEAKRVISKALGEKN